MKNDLKLNQTCFFCKLFINDRLFASNTSKMKKNYERVVAFPFKWFFNTLHSCSRTFQYSEPEGEVPCPDMGGYKITHWNSSQDKNYCTESRDNNMNSGKMTPESLKQGSVTRIGLLQHSQVCCWLQITTSFEQDAGATSSAAVHWQIRAESILWGFEILWLNYEEDVYYLFSVCAGIWCFD